MRGHIRKYKGRWAGVIELEPSTLPNGKKKRNQKWVYGDTQAEVEEKVAEIIDQVHKNDYIKSSKETVADFFETWLESYCKNNVTYNTHRNYKRAIDNHIKPSIGHMKLDRLKPFDIQLLYNSLSDKPSTAVYVHRVLHEALKHAKQWELTRNNPAENVVPPQAPKKQDYNVWSNNTVGKLLESIDNHILFMPVLIAASTGMRRGEICGLQWKDIDLTSGTIFIKKQLMRMNSNLVLCDTKTHKSSRPILIDMDIVPLLQRHKEIQTQNELMYGKIEKVYILENKQIIEINNDLVCTWEDGRPIDPDYVTKQFPKLAESLGFGSIRFHDLRHSHATELIRNKVSMKIVSDRLRHASMKTTSDIYTHVDLDMQKQSAKIGSGIIQKKPLKVILKRPHKRSGL